MIRSESNLPAPLGNFPSALALGGGGRGAVEVVTGAGFFSSYQQHTPDIFQMTGGDFSICAACAAYFPM